ncbi:hypothetical protein I302_101044 [Kwoniella bestiolae CBS 10118]|uniref:DNA-directed RNA polymerase III subunit RPC6 n=1 Tax=Kwoniella bestiolae CBS 10118 TaxID=1296100 RepID=A0A1B9G6U4_9TREE|nr:hypothetical protein I302_04420 [Kwoniella bestiolae CBS 10118]OCF26732.1 hypothetical protein I302_04420 [Kwoniella bestiolae CBS 10118]
MSMSTSDQQVWKKVLSAKNKYMTLPQIEASFPTMAKKAVTQSTANLVKLRLFSTSKSKDDDKTILFHAHTAEEAKQKSAMTPEQKIVLQVINQAGDRGIASAQIGRQIGNETMPQAILRKTVKNLESSGHIKQFKPVNAPTTIYYVMANVKIPEEISGGIWFDNNQEYDQGLVDMLASVLRNRVFQLTCIDNRDRTGRVKKEDLQDTKESLLIPHAMTLSNNKNYNLLTPLALRNYVNKVKVTSAELSVKNIMEVMRALELDGLVESIKPFNTSISFQEEDDLHDLDDAEGSSSKRRKLDGSGDEMDSEEEERAKEKAKQKLKEKKRRERQRERERERKEKKKKKEEKKRKEKEKEKERKRKRKEKEKAKKKKSKKHASDSDSDSDDALRSINDESSSKKRKKRARSSSVSSVSSSSSSSSSSSASSSSSSDSVSSVASDEIDDVLLPVKSKSNATANGQSNVIPTFFPGGLGGGITDLSDQNIIYKSTNRLAELLKGQNEISCGKCPVFSFCEEDGPVNPRGCTYLSGYLDDEVGGWDRNVLARMRGEQEHGHEGVEGMNGEGPVGEGMEGDHEMDGE